MDDLAMVMLEKRDGVTKAVEINKDKVEEMRKSEGHLCWTCSNYRNCDKITDAHKKTIDKYDFVTDGSQIIDENGEVDIFYVEGCNNFIMDKKNVKAGIEGIKERQTLKKFYFGVETNEEADKIMKELEERDIAAGRRRK